MINYMCNFNLRQRQPRERRRLCCQLLQNERGSLFLISLVFLMTVTLYVTITILSYTTYLETIDNYRFLEQQRIEQRMMTMQQSLTK